MSQFAHRTWYVLPAPRKMKWRYKENEEEIPVTVLAFSFEDNFPYWLTTNSVVIAGFELRDVGVG